MHAIGFGILFDSRVDECIYAFSKRLRETDNLQFSLEEGVSIPHVSAWQGKFEDTQAVVKRLQTELALPTLAPLRFSAVSVWATKIVFLNLEPKSYFIDLQREIRRIVGPLQSIGSADPQNFLGVNENQIKSYQETGYPFAQDPYEAIAPHVTIGHLPEPRECTQARGNEEQRFNLLWKNFEPREDVKPIRLVAFIVEPKGICRNILLEVPLE